MRGSGQKRELNAHMLTPDTAASCLVSGPLQKPSASPPAVELGRGGRHPLMLLKRAALRALGASRNASVRAHR
jgi:hypothetical protein